MKKMIVTVLAFVLALGGIPGCGKEGKKEQEDVFTVCVEPYWKMQVESAIDAWEALHKDTRVQLIQLPVQGTEAEVRISEMRTEIMSGGGPDLFILSGTNPNVSEETFDLFLNPEKLMHSEVFLPLDDYIADSEYMSKVVLNEKIMEAGRTKEGQMLVPLYYTYYAYAFPKSDAEMAFPSSWDELMDRKDPYLVENIWGQIAV